MPEMAYIIVKRDIKRKKVNYNGQNKNRVKTKPKKSSFADDLFRVGGLKSVSYIDPSFFCEKSF